DGETLGALLVAVPAEVGPLDEGLYAVVDQADVEPAVAHRDHFAGHDRVLAQLAGAGSLADRIARHLLDAERDALLLDIDVENLRLHHVATVVLLDDLLARTVPVEVGEVHHAVHIAFEADEQAEFGLVLDFAFDDRANRMVALEGVPGVLQRLLETQRDAALGRIDFQHDHIDLLCGRQDLAGMDVLLRPRHFGDVDEAFDAGLQLDERAVVGDVGDRSGDLLAQRELGADIAPRIRLELFHAQRDTMCLLVDADDLHLDRLADVEDLGRMVHAPPCHVGDMEQAIDAAQVHECAIVGDVLDHTLDNLA